MAPAPVSSAWRRGSPNSPVDADLARIARRVRAWRERSGWTLQRLAHRSGVAASTIQKVETQQMVPTIAVLLRIARGLSRSIGELVEDDSAEVLLARIPAAREPSWPTPTGVHCQRLVGALTEPILDACRVEYAPGCGSGEEALHFEGELLVVCEEGVVTVEVEGEDHVLSLGDALHFKARLPHRWINRGEGLARLLVTATAPDALEHLLSDGGAGVAHGDGCPSTPTSPST